MRVRGELGPRPILNLRPTLRARPGSASRAASHSPGPGAPRDGNVPRPRDLLPWLPGGAGHHTPALSGAAGEAGGFSSQQRHKRSRQPPQRPRGWQSPARSSPGAVRGTRARLELPSPCPQGAGTAVCPCLYRRHSEPRSHLGFGLVRFFSLGGSANASLLSRGRMLGEGEGDGFLRGVP